MIFMRKNCLKTGAIMSKLNSVRLSVVIATLTMTVFASAVNAQAPGVEERSEARRDRESVNAGTARKAESEHQKRVESGKKAADEYKSSNRDEKAKQNYQDAKKRDGF